MAARKDARHQGREVAAAGEVYAVRGQPGRAVVTSRRLLLPLAVLLVACFILANVFHSSDPGARGVVADISFFGFLLLALSFIVVGGVALVGRVRRTG